LIVLVELLIAQQCLSNCSVRYVVAGAEYQSSAAFRCILADATARIFLQQLLSELNKVSRFYVEKAEALEVRQRAVSSSGMNPASQAAGGGSCTALVLMICWRRFIALVAHITL
jgi:hypothetical protein